MADIARIADEVIDVCKLGTYCRGTLLGALREVADESKARIAALEEALRRPTDAMLKAGAEAFFDLDHSDLKRREAYRHVQRMWVAMARALLASDNREG